MRICSLLPSITEILFDIGAGPQVVGVTHECDWPREACQLPHLTKSRINTERSSSSDIDRQVREQAGSLYSLDNSLLSQLKPDLILTQSLCPVCAVDENAVRQLASTLPSQPAVYSYQPSSLSEVLGSIEHIGRVTGHPAGAEALLQRFESAIRHLKQPKDALGDRQTMICLEWLDPPFACGHWTPELIALAGGVEMLGTPGSPSRQASWHEVCQADPEVLLLAPCGLAISRTVSEAGVLERAEGWSDLKAVRSRRVFVTDGSAYFNRPGPRLIESLYIVAEVLDRGRFQGLAPEGSFLPLL